MVFGRMEKREMKQNPPFTSDSKKSLSVLPLC